MAKRSSLTPQFEYDDATAQYRWRTGPNKGRFVPRLAVREAIDQYLENKSRHVRAISEQLRNREISIADWQREMERTSAKVHLANAAAAKGGWHNLSKSDYGRVGRLVRDEYKYLRRFAIQIEKGLPLDGHFMQRALQYGEAGRHTYHVFETREMSARGYGEQRFIRHAKDSCEDCVSLAALGWHATGSTPEPGERKCKRKCKCGKEYRKGESQGEKLQLMALDPSDAEDMPPARLFTHTETAMQRQLAREVVDSSIVKSADYQGIDPKVARVVNQVIGENINEFPELKSKIQFLGAEKTALQRRLQGRRDSIRRIADDMGIPTGEAEQIWLTQVQEATKRHIAVYNSWPEVKGITIKEAYGQSQDELEAVLRGMTRQGALSPGHENVKGLIDHEIAHALSDLLKIESEPEVDIWFSALQSLSPKEQRRELSTGAAKSKHEFIAQAWASYKNSDSPSETAQAIGRLIEMRYNQRYPRGS